MVPVVRLWRPYLAALWKHWALLMGGGLTVLAAIASAILGWENWSRLAWVAVGALVIAQFLAWKDAWNQRGIPEEPYVARGLFLHYQRPGITAPRPRLPAEFTFRVVETSRTYSDLIPHTLELLISSREPLNQHPIQITATGPIYTKACNLVAQPTEGKSSVFLGYRFHNLGTNTVVFVCDVAEGGEPYSKITVRLGSVGPIRATRIEFASAAALAAALGDSKNAPDR